MLVGVGAQIMAVRGEAPNEVRLLCGPVEVPGEEEPGLDALFREDGPDVRAAVGEVPAREDERELPSRDTSPRTMPPSS